MPFFAGDVGGASTKPVGPRKCSTNAVVLVPVVVGGLASADAVATTATSTIEATSHDVNFTLISTPFVVDNATVGTVGRAVIGRAEGSPGRRLARGEDAAAGMLR
jgi:hypothetical protein